MGVCDGWPRRANINYAAFCRMTFRVGVSWMPKKGPALMVSKPTVSIADLTAWKTWAANLSPKTFVMVQSLVAYFKSVLLSFS